MSETVAARWEEYNESGRRSFGLGQMAEAEELFRAAVREGEQLGADSPHLATSLNALGQIRLQAKDFAEAESCFTRALAIREQTYGAESHATVPSLNNLSALHDAKGDTDKAVELLRRSLAISEQALGAAHPEVALALNNLAKLYFKRRDFAKADRLLLRLLETKRALGKDHPEVATVLGSLAKLRQAVGKHAAAEQLWRQSLAIRERAFAPNDAILATTLESVADCCAAQEGRVNDAIALRERALEIREVASGAGHPSVAAASAKLTELRARPGATIPLAPPASGPSRNSQEVPSPIFSHEVPPYTPGQAAPAPGLPWLQIDSEPTGERPQARMELMGNEPEMPAPFASPAPPATPAPRAAERTASLTPRPPSVLPPVPPVAGRSSRELVFTDSLAPEATPVEPRRPDRGARPAPQAPARDRDTRHPHPNPAHAPAHAPARRPMHMPPPTIQSNRKSKKALLFTLMLVAFAGAGGWLLFGRKAPGLNSILPAITRTTSTPLAAVAKVVQATKQPAAPAMQEQARSTQAASLAAARRDSVRSEAAGAATSTPVAPTNRQSARPDTAAKTVAPAAKETPAPEANLSAPSIPVNVQIDDVTKGIEQSTSAKVDSAEKARLEVKQPIFRKP